MVEARRQAIDEALRGWTDDRMATFVELFRDFNEAVEAHSRSAGTTTTPRCRGARRQPGEHVSQSAARPEARLGQAATNGGRARLRPTAAGAAATAPAPADSGVLTHRQIVTILIGLMMGMFLAALDQTVVTTAMRTIADDLHGFSLQAWATTAFLITSTISTPLYGKLSDIYGRKPFFLFAIGVFIVGSALCGLSQSMYELAAFRAVQGIGAGGLMSLALAIIGDIVPPRERAKYQGYFLAVFGTSSVLGPVLGGFFAGADTILGVAGWRWIFYINVPIAAAAMIVVIAVLHIPHTRTDHRIDWPGAIALIVGLVPLLIVAEQGREWGWGSGRSLLCYVIGAGRPGRVHPDRALVRRRGAAAAAAVPRPDVRGRLGQQLHPRHGACSAAC